MAYMWVIGDCINCGTMINFNPNHVPSLIIDGVREPLCEKCFDRWNEIHRISKDYGPVPLHPNAYKPEEVSY